MNEEEKLDNTIFLHQGRIYELKTLRDIIQKSEGNEVRFKVETKHWYGFSEPFLGKEQSRLNITKGTIETIIDTAIQNEKDIINKCIDIEIELRQREKEKKTNE